MNTIETVAYVLLAIITAAIIGYNIARDQHEQTTMVWLALISSSALTVLLAVTGIYAIWLA